MEKICIAEGANRFSEVWHNKDVDWNYFVNKCSTPIRTKETAEQYRSFPKKSRDNIKDHGSYLFAYIKGGRRKKENIMHLQGIALDMDYPVAGSDIWGDFKSILGCQALVYSTHSHTPENPRLRIAFPLDRPVTPDEYEPIARRVAKYIGIECADPTTYQYNRLMHYPSMPIDVPYYFDTCEGPVLCADTILATYEDWTDSTTWPISGRESVRILSEVRKAGDPREKPSYVGAFCRAYTIQSCIAEFIPEAYTETSHSDRFSYTQGTTSGGMIVYNDVFAYSHHGSDPISGKLVNAFDLVRVHKFEDLDHGTKADTPPHKKPSFAAMMELIKDLEDVKAEIMAERKNEMLSEFNVLPDETSNLDWVNQMDLDGKKLDSSWKNILLVLANDPAIKGAIALNDFTGCFQVVKPFPWDASFNRKINDYDVSFLNAHMGSKPYEFTDLRKLNHAINITAVENRFHPVRDFLDGLMWDGLPRLETLFIDYLGAEDSAYNRSITVKTLVAAVARIKEPGIKFDNVLTLVGPEGIGKSRLLKKLGGAWFSDSFSFSELAHNQKNAQEKLIGKWIIEMGEMVGLNKVDATAVKNFISSEIDTYRAAYGRFTNDIPRQCIFIGSTNNYDFLKGAFGNRRFWPMDVWVTKPKLRIEDMPVEVLHQIWAEALTLYQLGESTHLDDEMEFVARDYQKEHEEDSNTGSIEEFIHTPILENWYDLSIDERKLYFLDTSTIRGKVQRKTISAIEVWVEFMGGRPEDKALLSNHILNGINLTLSRISGLDQRRVRLVIPGYGKRKSFNVTPRSDP